MKILNTIQELWSYCLFCPICQDITREIWVSTGPDDVLDLSSHKKIDNILILSCFFHYKRQKSKIVFNINCLDNSFKVDISDPTPSTRNVEGSEIPYFTFFIGGDCKVCSSTHLSSIESQLDLLKLSISNIGIDSETISIFDEKSEWTYILSYEYDINKIKILKSKVDDNGDLTFWKNPPEIPIVNFDFSNPKKVINRIKTLLVFS